MDDIQVREAIKAFNPTLRDEMITPEMVLKCKPILVELVEKLTKEKK